MLKSLFGLLAGCAMTLALLISGCHDIGMADTMSMSSHQREQSLLIRESWEQEMGRVATEGCALRGLRLTCNW